MTKGLGIVMASILAGSLAASNREVGLFREEPLIDTTKGRKQLTYHDKIRLQAQAHEDRIAKAEEKRKRRAAKLKRDIKEN